VTRKFEKQINFIVMMRCTSWMMGLCVVASVVGCTYDDLETLGNPYDCDVFDVSYGADILPLVADNCQGCHSGGTPSAGIAFEEHADIAQLAEGMLDRMDRAPNDDLLMPQSGKLDSCSIALFSAWIAAGKPNN
jgi:hypothetical protein